jgi:deoxycytidylate deaminase
MANQLLKLEAQKSNQKSTHDKSSTSDMLEKRRSEELILAFAGPIGCGIKLAISEAQSSLESIGYKVHVIKLSRLIERNIDNGNIVITTPGDSLSKGAQRIIRLQNGGNALRKQEGTSILVENAIQEIVILRGKQQKEDNFDGNFMDYVPKLTAYLIDQVKHPDEVSLLRIVYGQMFNLIGVISVAEKRRSRLSGMDKISANEISDLMERDRRQEADNEQQLDKALQMADFFISTDHGTTTSLQSKLKRFFDLIHGGNGITPTSQEYGMYTAYAASLKSACLSRQVGASISDRTGKIVSTGCNDVPKAMGGLYSSDDHTHDRRCVHRDEQVCFNDREKNSLKDDMKQALMLLRKAQTSDSPSDVPSDVPLIDEHEIEKVLNVVYKASHIGDLIEFSRAVHAEMDAIISLARSGTPGIVGANLYTTTFPCHSCARHIVAAGIVKVYYIEPYEKSLAQKLHDDAIAFETEDDDAEKVGYNPQLHSQRVRFIHFEGVAPRQYLNYFKMVNRKNKDGTVIKIIARDAQKVNSEYLDDYRKFETKVVARLIGSQPIPKLVEPEQQ